MKLAIQPLAIALTLCATAALAVPPDRPPCQAGDRSQKTTHFPGVNAPIPDPTPPPECTVIRGCIDDSVRLFSIAPGTNPDMAAINYEYHAQVTLDSDNLLGTKQANRASNSGSNKAPEPQPDPVLIPYRQTELMRMKADLWSDDQLLATDETVMVAHQRWSGQHFELVFEIMDPDSTSVIYGDPGPGGGPPVTIYSFDTLTTDPVNVGPDGENRHFMFRIKNNRTKFVIVTWDQNDDQVRFNALFPDLPGVQFDNVTLTVDSPDNHGGSAPQAFESDYFHKEATFEETLAY